MSNKKPQQVVKFDWGRRESGGPRKKTEDLGFDGNLQKKGVTKTKKFTEEHKEFRKDIRKPR